MTPDSFQLPDFSASAGFVDEVDATLLDVVRRENDRYHDHAIEVLPTKTTRTDADQTVVLSYALYLSFAQSNGFSYRLLELTSRQTNGGLPVTVQAFSGPPVSLGEATTRQELAQKIDEVFRSPRARFLINTYYQP